MVVCSEAFSYYQSFLISAGWAATVRFNSTVRDQLGQFKARSDTFSLGVCNGCQLMGLLGWVAPAGTGKLKICLGQLV